MLPGGGKKKPAHSLCVTSNTTWLASYYSQKMETKKYARLLCKWAGSSHFLLYMHEFLSNNLLEGFHFKSHNHFPNKWLPAEHPEERKQMLFPNHFILHWLLDQTLGVSPIILLMAIYRDFFKEFLHFVICFLIPISNGIPSKYLCHLKAKSF